ncbi:enoyl-CoA hydratase [Bibersteinia trehalosi Y31]|uniref:Enoyl-CoA hydratase n=1 Tax=Bibersteinia trehalosi Y31 TaxID=1261658 RepID=A0A179CZP1_BIBTR|nr:hypothetical protein [Bibersteinia trehalosi]OAQ15037.1 enoyl-CoA hydratase [Bibersteinia trehalosi Y31]
MSKVYLAMYKAEGNWVDKVIRLFTGKPYSHCEIFIETVELRKVYDEDFEPTLRALPCYKAYSSSPRDGGVRCKTITRPTNTYGGAFKPENWDLFLLPYASGQKVEAFYQKTRGKKYDFLGAVGCVIPIREKPNRWYCSEWCYQAITGDHKQLSPNKLAEYVKART